MAVPPKPASRTFHVRGATAGQTLAAALKRLIPGTSWAEAKNLLASRRVHVNGNLCVDEARRLALGDVVHVFQHPRAAPAGESDVVVRYIDGDVVVIEKPPGVTTLRHREERGWPARRKDRMPTLEELVQRVIEKHGQAAKAGMPRKKKAASRGPIRPPRRPAMPRVRPVHRLDRDTSGLMLFALSPRAEAELIRQFAAHRVERVYVAVVHGHPEAQTIESWIVRDRGDGLRGSMTASAGGTDGQRAVTHLKPLERIGPYCVVECRLKTGRTHQIRIHLAEAGHMLCGEKTYTHRLGEAPRSDESGAPRQALHSRDLTFTHPGTGKTISFTSRWPRDLAEWLERLKASARSQPERRSLA